MGDNDSNKRPAEMDIEELKKETEADVPEAADNDVKTEDGEKEVATAAAGSEGTGEANGEPASNPEEETGGADGEPASTPEVAASEPVTIEYLTFKDGRECHQYYLRLLKDLRKDQNLNDYEFNMVMGLLKMGHHNVEEKIGPGVTAIQVRDQQYVDGSSSTFILVRADGTQDDFSVRKCVAKLFPGFQPAKGGRGVGSERGRGGRGRGGRGRGRGFRGRRGGRQGGRH